MTAPLQAQTAPTASAPALCRKDDGIVARCARTNEVLFARFEIEEPPRDAAPVSRTDQFGVASTPGTFCAVAVVRKVNHFRYHGIHVKVLKTPIIIDDCPMRYKVYLLAGENKPERPIALFYFPEFHNPRIPEKEKNQRFADVIGKYNHSERNHLEQGGAELRKKQMEAAPARLPFEERTSDHYKNWNDCAQAVLRKEWVNFFRANDALLAAKGEADKVKLKTEVWKAYIIDYKTLTGSLPELTGSDRAELLGDDDFVRALAISMDRPRPIVSLVIKQLLGGWIAKNYYRMNDKALEAAFNKDWNYKKGQHKGNTLAKCARSIGLKFALKRGRPERANRLPAG